MTSIQDLPDELLYEMCEGWNDKVLVNMAESYSRVYQICSKIIEQRKNSYIEEKQIIDKITSEIKNRKIIFYKKSFPGGIEVEVTLAPSFIHRSDKLLSLNQIIKFNINKNEDPAKEKIRVSNTVPLIIPTRFDESKDIVEAMGGKRGFMRYVNINNDYDSIASLIRSLIQQGYIYSGSFAL